MSLYRWLSTTFTSILTSLDIYATTTILTTWFAVALSAIASLGDLHLHGHRVFDFEFTACDILQLVLDLGIGRQELQQVLRGNLCSVHLHRDILQQLAGTTHASLITFHRTHLQLAWIRELRVETFMPHCLHHQCSIEDDEYLDSDLNLPSEHEHQDEFLQNYVSRDWDLSTHASRVGIPALTFQLLSIDDLLDDLGADDDDDERMSSVPSLQVQPERGKEL